MAVQYFRNGVPIDAADALDERGIMRDGVGCTRRMTFMDGAPRDFGDAAAFAASPAGRAAVARAQCTHDRSQRYLGDRARPFSDAQAAQAVQAAMIARDAAPPTFADAAELSRLRGARDTAHAMRSERQRNGCRSTEGR